MRCRSGFLRLGEPFLVVSRIRSADAIGASQGLDRLPHDSPRVTSLAAAGAGSGPGAIKASFQAVPGLLLQRPPWESRQARERGEVSVSA